MKKQIYLMRHAETYFNEIGKIQGWCDSPLTELGVKQAEFVRDYFTDNGLTFDSYYTSRQSRAIDSLEIMTDYKATYKEVLDLREFGFGRFESESSALMPRPPFGGYFLQFGGESQNEANERFNTAMEKIVREDPNEKILVMSHGTIIKEFCQRWVATADFDVIISVPNCSILVFEYEEASFSLKDHIIHDFPAHEPTLMTNFIV